MLRLLLLNATGLALLVASYLAGLFQVVVLHDKTYISQGIFLLLVVGVAMCFRPRWHRAARYVAATLVDLGLIGTVIGWMIAFASVKPDQVTDVAAILPIVAGLIAGMATSLTATLVGAIGSLWISLNLRLYGD